MGFVVGTLKFISGAVIGAAVGAAVTTFIVTRDGGQTISQLRELVGEVQSGAKDAYKEEEGRMTARYQQLIGEAGTARKLAKENKKKDEGK